MGHDPQANCQVPQLEQGFQGQVGLPSVLRMVSAGSGQMVAVRGVGGGVAVNHGNCSEAGKILSSQRRCLLSWVVMIEPGSLAPQTPPPRPQDPPAPDPPAKIMPALPSG